MQIPIRGVPQRVERGWHGGETCAYSEGLVHYLEFKVVTAEPEYRRGHEALMAMAVNNPARIGFQVEDEEGRMFLAFVPRGISGISHRLGVLPPVAKMFMREAWERRLFEEHLSAISYAVEMSIAGREVDRDQVMGMADYGELDTLTDDEFDELIDSIHETLDGEVSVVRVLIRVSAKGEMEMIESGKSLEVIDV